KRPNLAISYLLIIIMVFSVIYFMAAGTFYSVKSYWDSYKKYIIEQKLDKSYYGFYDFEKFIYWLDKKIPPGQNLSVLVKGEPVYIMAEMVYNLYPRDIQFVDIDKKTSDEIISRLQKINRNGHAPNTYKYVLILSGEQKIEIGNMQFVSKYSKNGGLLYILK
ncbi:MAG: hypothetical protein JW997_07230, partial [Actinobacteria bacterium]|nr:hypothetical protein [Actinomycetota bacterium]